MTDDYKKGCVILADGVYLENIPGHNLNVFVYGKPGSGKTMLIKNNILQTEDSFVVFDKTKQLYDEMQQELRDKGYDVRLFTSEESDDIQSDAYNPFDNITHCIKAGTIDPKPYAEALYVNLPRHEEKPQSGDDPYWVMTEKALFMALAFYMCEFMEPEDCNFHILSKLSGRGSERALEGTLLDLLFEEAKKKTPDAACLEYYDTFKLAPEKTRESVAIMLHTAVNRFETDTQLKRQTTTYPYKKDIIDINHIQDKKTAVFIHIPSASPIHEYLANMLILHLKHHYSGLKKSGDGYIPAHITVFIDELDRMQKIPGLMDILGSGKYMGISFFMTTQSGEQVNRIYWDDDKMSCIPEMMLSCDPVVFLSKPDEYDRILYNAFVSANEDISDNECLVYTNSNRRAVRVRKYGLPVAAAADVSDEQAVNLSETEDTDSKPDGYAKNLSEIADSLSTIAEKLNTIATGMAGNGNAGDVNGLGIF